MIATMYHCFLKIINDDAICCSVIINLILILLI